MCVSLRCSYWGQDSAPLGLFRWERFHRPMGEDGICYCTKPSFACQNWARAIPITLTRRARCANTQAFESGWVTWLRCTSPRPWVETLPCRGLRLHIWSQFSKYSYMLLAHNNLAKDKLPCLLWFLPPSLPAGARESEMHKQRVSPYIYIQRPHRRGLPQCAKQCSCFLPCLFLFFFQRFAL